MLDAPGKLGDWISNGVEQTLQVSQTNACPVVQHALLASRHGCGAAVCVAGDSRAMQQSNNA